MTVLGALYVFALFIVVGASTYLVLSHKFNDTMCERVYLTTVSLCGLVEIYHRVRGSHSPLQEWMLFALVIAFIALGVERISNHPVDLHRV